MLHYTTPLKGGYLMKFIYPAVIHQTSSGQYKAYFPDLESCTAEGDTLFDVLDNANAAAKDWISIELEEDDVELPPVSDASDITLKDDEFIRNISVNIRFYEGWDE